MNFVHKDDIIMLIGKVYDLLSNFADLINSKIIEILEIENVSNQLKYWTIFDIKKNMVLHHNGIK